jgi:hypothetical protein
MVETKPENLDIDDDVSRVQVKLDAVLNWRVGFDLQDVYHWYISGGHNGAYVLKVKHKESDKEYEEIENEPLESGAFDEIFSEPISVSMNSIKGVGYSDEIEVNLELHTSPK